MMSVQVNKKHMDLNSLKLYKPLKINYVGKMCFKFINLRIILPWFLNGFVLGRTLQLFAKLKDKWEHGSVRAKRLMFVNLMGVGP